MFFYGAMRKKIFRYLFVFFLPLFFGCGLDNFYYLDPPLHGGHVAYYNSSEDILNFCSCLTNESSSTGVNYMYFGASDFYFLGTEIYYKIFNNISTLQSVESSVSSMISNTSSYTSAVDYLIGSRGFKTLGVSDGKISPLIKPSSGRTNQYVYIRLDNYNDTDYRSGICVGNSSSNKWTEEKSLKVNGKNVTPVRYGTGCGFDFSRTGKNNSPIPKKGDDDVEFSETPTEDGVWYVLMYAASVGRDTNYSESYSQPYLMGELAIREKD